MNAYHIAAAAVLAALASAASARSEPVRFERDGRTFVYTTEQAGPRTVISGRTYPDGARFRLVVRDTFVSGAVDGRPVSFRTAEAKGAATVLASAF